MSTAVTAVERIGDETLEVLQVPLDQLRESPLNPRKTYSEAGLKELTDSIREHGVLVPLLVRRIRRGEFYEIMAGSRRFRAVQLAKLDGVQSVPVRVMTLSDGQALELMLIENLQREDVSPIEEATGYQRLVDDAGLEVSQIAARVGKSASYVYQRLKLADLSPAAGEALQRGDITAGHAILLARLPAVDQRKILERVGGGHTVRDMAAWITNQVHRDLRKAPWPKDDATLVPQAGPCIVCRKRAGNQPDLFSDLKPDTCTDQQCFEQKFEAYVARRMKGENLIRLAEHYGQEKGALSPDKWEEARKACEHQVKGIFGTSGGRRGQVVNVCTEKTCKIHRLGSPGSYSPSPQEKARAAAQDRKVKLEREWRRRTLQNILDRVAEGLGPDDLRLIAGGLYDRLWHQHRKQICEKRSWQTSKADAEIPKLGGLDLSRLLLEAALIGETDYGPYHQTDSKRLVEAARRYHVNGDAIRRQLVQEAARKLQTSAKPKSKKAAAGGRTR